MKDVPILLRDADEIQRAHDLLGGLIHEGLVHEPLISILENSLDVLCWVLRHNEDSNFGDNLATMERILAKYHLRLVKDPEEGIRPKDVM